jgi:TIR domain
MTTSRWDLFIAYTSPDRQHAERLFQAIGQKLRVFLDYQSLKPGDDFDLVTPLAQREARGTAVLISESFTSSLYARAEAAAALACMRVNPSYKVLAIYLKGIPPVYDMPYGLNVTQAIDFHNAGEKRAIRVRLTLGPVFARWTDANHSARAR